MSLIHLQSTKYSPEVLLTSSGKILLKGISVMEDVYEFYQPIIDWVSEYGSDPCEQTKVEINLSHYNTSSSKNILELLKLLAEMHNNKSSIVNIDWYVEEDDENMRETGEDLQEILNIRFNFVIIPDED